jgi:nicotinamidase-related amidase
MTREQMRDDLIDLVPELATYVPPGQVVDKTVLSPWNTSLVSLLGRAGVESLIISGAETEVCVSATVLGAIDHGFRVLIATDAVCSGADETHDAMMKIYQQRFGMQVETVKVAELLEARLQGLLQ